MADIIVPSTEAGYDDTPCNVYRADEIEFWGSVEPKTFLLYNKTAILNQQEVNIPKTTNGCGAFSQSKVNNELNFNEWTYPSVNCFPLPFWVETLKDYDGKIEIGSWLHANALNAKDNSRISGFYKATTVTEMKEALLKGHIIVTGSRYVDWYNVLRSTNKVLTFIQDPSFWHLFPITGFDDTKKCFIIPNSWGKDVLDHGLCYVKYEDIDKLYSRLACVDKPNAEVINQIERDRLDLKEAKDKWYWNGLNPESQAKRYEAILMMLRPSNAWQDDNIILTRSVLDWIRSGKRPDDNITRGETVIIIMRGILNQFWDDTVLYQAGKNMGLWNGNNADSTATRAQVMLMIMRWLRIATWIVVTI